MTSFSVSNNHAEHRAANSFKLEKAIILSLLSKLRVGRLDLIEPDGRRHCFGEGRGETTATIFVKNDEFFKRCLLYADIGLAESYCDGICDISSIKDVVSVFLLNQNQSPFLNNSPALSRSINLLGVINRLKQDLRGNSKLASRKNISDHYDLGNEFFAQFLDATMTYSAALFLRPSMTLEQAQLAKFARIAKQMRVKSSDRILDVGCGWGAFSCYLAEEFGCRVTAITLSKKQYEYAERVIQSRRLEKFVELRLEDYREHEGVYDKIASIEMIEAVGDKYLDTFVAKLDSLLVQNGLLVMQMITCPDSRYRYLKSNVDFIQKHIFPGSLLPSLDRITRGMMACGELFLVDLFDMTESYTRTLELWQDNFEGKLETIRSQCFDEKFIRRWRYYFEYCQAAFAMRNISVVQATYSRPNNPTLKKGASLV